MTQTKKTVTLGLIPKLIIAIVLGIIVGAYLPETLGGFALRQTVTAIAVTVSQNFGKLLNFIIPLMVLAFVTSGISDLAEGFRVIIMTRADSNDEYRILASLQKNKIGKVG